MQMQTIGWHLEEGRGKGRVQQNIQTLNLGFVLSCSRSSSIVCILAGDFVRPFQCVFGEPLILSSFPESWK